MVFLIELLHLLLQVYLSLGFEVITLEDQVESRQIFLLLDLRLLVQHLFIYADLMYLGGDLLGLDFCLKAFQGVMKPRVAQILLHVLIDFLCFG